MNVLKLFFLASLIFSTNVFAYDLHVSHSGYILKSAVHGRTFRHIVNGVDAVSRYIKNVGQCSEVTGSYKLKPGILTLAHYIYEIDALNCKEIESFEIKDMYEAPYGYARIKLKVKFRSFKSIVYLEV